jgi:hypothetical protein
MRTVGVPPSAATVVRPHFEPLEVEPTPSLPPEPTKGPRRQVQSLLGRTVASRLFWIVTIGTLALLARLIAVSTSYDIFIDEATYTKIAINVAHGRGLVLYGQPFALHPPAAFGLYGLAIDVFRFQGSTETVLFELRHVVVVIGAATCVLTFLLVDRAAPRLVAVVAALFAALDPLIISYDSRVMLEAPSQLAAVSMVLLLAVAVDAQPGSGSRWRWLVGAGTAAAAVLSIKETFGLVAVLCLLCLFACGWVISRREALAVLGTAALGYGVTVVSVALSSGFGVWWGAQRDGVLRLVGAEQISGFNSPQVHVSLLSRVLANVSILAVSYAILVLGSMAALGVLWRIRPWGSGRTGLDCRARITVLCAIWTVSAGAYLVYATLFGTLEEQMYYILLLPCIVSLCLWLAGFMKARSVRWRALVVALIGVALLFNSAVWFKIHAGQDDEYRRLLSWESAHVSPTAVIAVTEYLSQFLLTGGVIGQWSTVPELKAHHVDYVIIGTNLVKQGYGLADPQFENYLEHNARLVFEANGRSDGSLRIYDVHGITGADR